MTCILGIETSCDETAASVVQDGLAARSNVIASQHQLHREYGGVVPEIASRAHLERISDIIEQALDDAGVSMSDIDAVAVGNRPGLIGSLLVGVSAAKSIAWSMGKPLIGVDHVQAHLYAAAIALPGKEVPPPLSYPALGLVVSGGHSSLYHVSGPCDAVTIGSTIDDAVGEAYDKAAVILDAGYPGGPKLDKLAQQGDASQVDPLPRSMLDADSLNFSFSGLKTALLYRVRGKPQGRGSDTTFLKSAADHSPEELANLAAAFQQAAVDAVIKKIERALDQLSAKNQPAQCLIVGGGVSANSALRRRSLELGEARDLPVHLPPMPLCVDNAAMIAGLAHHLLINGQCDTLDLPALATSKRGR